MTDDGALLARLDETDWAALHHAYGPAGEVPDLLRGLVSEDPAVRETALDAMYGAVHHQGDVYDSTLAAIPFLIEIAGRPGGPGRDAVVELLASIGGVPYPGEDEDEDEDDDEADDDESDGADDPYQRARAAVAEAYPLFLCLLADPDPAVRAAAPRALLAGPAAAGPAVAALRERLAVEPDPPVRAAVAGALSLLARRAAAGRLPGVPAAPIVAALTELARDSATPALRLTALAELARCAPDSLPPEVVPVVLDALDAVYAEDTPPSEPAGFSTDTLVGALRELREQEAAGRPAPEAAELVGDLSRALGDRVEERTLLLTTLLRASEWERRYDAILPAKSLIEGWRGAYGELVHLLGEQLLDARPRVVAAAAGALHHLDAVAAPAADALARALDATPREAPHDRHGPPPWVIRWPRDLPTVGPVLAALTALADPRALPAVRWALDHPEPPAEVGQLIARYGPVAADLAPVIRERLRDLPRTDGHDRRRWGLVTAVGAIGAPAAVCLPELLALPADTAVLTALGRLGPAAVEAVPALPPLLGHADRSVAVTAAQALWRITGDPAPVLPVLDRFLRGDEYDKRSAAEVIAELGPVAAPLAPRLLRTRATKDRYGWLRLALATARWRVTGDHEPLLPVLGAVWTENPLIRREVVGTLTALGPAAAEAAPLVRAELGRIRRHNAHDGGWSSDQVAADEALLRGCRAALAAMDAE